MTLEISPEQFRQMEQIERAWWQRALSTAPADRAAAEEAICAGYQASGRPAPECILWCESPYQAYLTIAYLKAKHWRDIWKRSHARHGEAVWRRFEANFQANFGGSVTDPFWDEVGRRFEIDWQGATSSANPADRDIWMWLWERYNAPSPFRFGQTLETVAAAAFWPDDLEADALGRLRVTLDTDEYDTNIYWHKTGSQHDILMLLIYDHWYHAFGLGGNPRQFELHTQLARSAGWWWLLERLAIVTERPALIRLDDERRLHSDDGAALVFRDGWEVYSVQGVRVPANAVRDPASITVAQIERQRNLETRRVLIERYGIERFLADSGAEEIQRDEYGILYRRRFSGQQEPLMFLKVANRTPEADGTFRDYFIRVPPGMQSAHQAVAWTFGLRKDQYHPYSET